MLVIMVAARDALSTKMVMGEKPSTRKEFAIILKRVRFCQDTLCQKRLLGRKRALMQLAHKSALDYLKDKDAAGVYAVNVGQGHMLLADRCRRALKVRSELKVKDPDVRYSLRHFVHHVCYLHEHPYHPKDGPSGPDPLQEAARVLLDLDWLLDRLFLDKDTQGVVDDMKQVSRLLEARGNDGDAELAESIGAVQAMTERARFAVRHDPRQIMGRIMLELSDDTRAPVVDLVKRTRKCKRFRWWYLRKGTLRMRGAGPDLTCVGEYAFNGECDGGME